MPKKTNRQKEILVIRCNQVQPTPNQWNKVDEMLPDEGEHVVFYSQIEDCWTEGYIDSFGLFWNTQDEQPSREYPTHWMKIGKP